MQPEYVSVGQLFSRNSVYVVPLFQRPYVWERDRWELLWEDVRQVAEDILDDEAQPVRHFLGSIVLQKRQSPDLKISRHEVIDGQQRLTTLQLLLKASADELENDIVTGETALSLVPLLRHPFAATADVEGHYKVWPTNIDRRPFRNVMDGVVHDTQPSRFRESYLFFRATLKAWLRDGGSSLEMRARRADALTKALHQYLCLIVLNLAEDDQAQVIFETLNARGTKLTVGDLVKNVMLRRAQEEGAYISVLYERYWKSFDEDPIWQETIGGGYTARPHIDFFLQQALTVMTGKPIPMSKVYQFFVKHLNSTRLQVSAEAHMKKISGLAATARHIYTANDDHPDRSLVVAARIRQMDFMTALPALMVLIGNSDRNPADISTAASLIESFLVRRMVCDLNSGMYGLFFVDLMNDIIKAESATDAVTVRLRKETSDSTRWPDDEEFGSAWRNYPLFRTLRRNRIVMMLRALEVSLRGSHASDLDPLPRTLRVERIMPQHWEQWWPLAPGSDGIAHAKRNEKVMTIGNLTLVRQKLSESASMAPWNTGEADSKRAALRQHGQLQLNAMLGAYETWDERAIASRTEKLFTHAVKVWPGPRSELG